MGLSNPSKTDHRLWRGVERPWTAAQPQPVVLRQSTFPGCHRTRPSRGRNAMAIWQDLVDTCEFSASYQSVQRFVRKLHPSHSPEACAVIETAAGGECQVDYGSSMVSALLRGGLKTIGLAQTRPGRGRAGPNPSHSSHVISLFDIAKAQHPLGISP
jgi:hypothetical protein